MQHGKSRPGTRLAALKCELVDRVCLLFSAFPFPCVRCLPWLAIFDFPNARHTWCESFPTEAGPWDEGDTNTSVRHVRALESECPLVRRPVLWQPGQRDGFQTVLSVSIRVSSVAHALRSNRESINGDEPSEKLRPAVEPLSVSRTLAGGRGPLAHIGTLN